MSDVSAAEVVASSAGTSAEGTTDLGATSTESVGADQAASSPAEEPILYAVKVGGKEEKVTFDELTNGYMRQADYTRKTQELSKERESHAQALALHDALTRDPEGTVRAIAAKLNMDLGTAARVAAQAVSEVDDNDPLQRIERQLSQFTQQLSAREQAEQAARDEATRQASAQAQIEREMQQLRDTHGDFPEEEFLSYAALMARESGQVVPLAITYRAWQYDALEQKRIAELNAATEAKRRAQVVSGGHSSAPAAVASGAAPERGIAAAYLAAKRAHGNQ